MKNKHQIFNPDGSLNNIALEGSISDLYKVSDDSAFQKTAESQQDTYNRVTYLQPPKNIGTEITEATDPTSQKSASLSVFWEEAKGADRYQTELVIGGETEAARINESTDTTTVFPGLTGTLSLSVRVRSIAGREFSAWSDPVSVTIHYNSLGLQIPQNLGAKKLFSFVHCSLDQPPKSQSGSKFEFFVAKLADVDPVTFEFTPKESQKKATTFGNHCWFFDIDNETIYVKARAYDDSGKYSNYTAVATSSKFGEIANDWDPELEVVDGAHIIAFLKDDYTMGVKFKAYELTDETQPPVAGYTLRWQKDGDSDWLWEERWFGVEELYVAGDFTYATIYNLSKKPPLGGADYVYKVQIKVVDQVLATSAWKPDPAVEFSVFDLTDPPDPSGVVDLEVISPAGDYSAAEIGPWGNAKCFCTLGLPEVDAAGVKGVVTNLIKSVTYRIRKETWPHLWSIEVTREINSLEAVTVGAVVYRMLRLDNLDSNTTHQIQMKYEDFTGDMNATGWVTPITDFTTTDPQPMDMADATSFSAEMIPKRLKFFGDIEYRLNVQFDVPAGDYYAKHYEVKLAWKNWAGTWDYWIYEIFDIVDYVGDHVESFFPVNVIPSETYENLAYAGFRINVRAWMGTKEGAARYDDEGDYDWLDAETWGAASAVTFGIANTSISHDAITLDAPKVGWFRFATIKPIPDAYDLPEDFDRVDLHAVYPGETLKDPDDGWPNSFIGSYTKTAGNTELILIPFFVWSSSRSALFPVWDATTVDFYSVLKTSQYDAPTKQMRVKTAITSSSANAVDTYNQFAIGASVAATQVKMVAIYGGDLLFAPNVMVTWPFNNTSTTRIYCDNIPQGSAQVLAIGDLLMVGKQARTMTTTAEIMHVTAVANTYVDVTRGLYSSTKDSGDAGVILIKIGEKSGEYRYSWVDATSDSYKVVRTEDTGAAVTWTTQAEFGAGSTDPQWNEGDIYISGDHKMEVTGDLELKAGGNLKLNAGTVTIAGSTVNMTAGDFNVSSTGSVNITATGGLNMSGGSTVFSGGTFTMSGSAINMTAGTFTFTGSSFLVNAGYININQVDGLRVTNGKNLNLARGGDIEFNDCCLLDADEPVSGTQRFRILPHASAATALFTVGTSADEWDGIAMFSSDVFGIYADGEFSVTCLDGVGISASDELALSSGDDMALISAKDLHLYAGTAGTHFVYVDLDNLGGTVRHYKLYVSDLTNVVYAYA